MKLTYEEAVKRAQKKAIQSKLSNYSQKQQNLIDRYGNYNQADWHTQDEANAYYNALQEVRDLTDLYRYYVDTYESGNKALSGQLGTAVGNYDSILSGKNDFLDMYSQYTNPEDFNAAYAHMQETAKKYGADNYSIEDKEALLDQLYKDKEVFKGFETAVGIGQSFDMPISDGNGNDIYFTDYFTEYDKNADLSTTQGQKDALESLNLDTRIRELEDELRTARLFQAPNLDDLADFSTYSAPTRDAERALKRENLDNHLTDEERARYYYLYNTQGADKATQYAEDLTATLESRQLDAIRKWSGKNIGTGILGTLASFGTSAASMLESIGDQSKYFMSGGLEEMDDIYTARMTDAFRSGVTDNLGGFGDFVYGVGTSAVESYLASLIPGGGLLLGANAAASAINSALDRGATSEQAFFSGLAAGAFETLFESFSIERLKSVKKIIEDGGPKALKDIVKQVAVSMGVEASEEAATEAANLLYDTIALGDISNYALAMQDYIDQGMSEDEARKKVNTEFGLQIGEAALSGAVMGGVKTGAKAVETNARVAHAKNKYFTEQGKNILNSPDAESIIEEYKYAANEFKDVDSVAKAAGKYNKKAAAEEKKVLAERASADVQKTMSEAHSEAQRLKLSSDGRSGVTLGKMPAIVDYSGASSNNITIKDADGNEVKLSEAELADDDVGVAYILASQLGSVDAANAFIKAYNAESEQGYISPDSFYVDWLSIQSHGQISTWEGAMEKAFSAVGDRISEASKGAAFLAGRGLRESVSQKYEAEQAKYDKAWKEAGGKTVNATFKDTALRGKTLSQDQQDYRSFLRAYSRAMGTNVEVFYSEKGARKENGSYNRSTNTLRIDINAGISNKATYDAVQNNVIGTLSHETVHNMRVTASKQYEALRDFVTAELEKNTDYDLEKNVEDEIARYAAKGQKISREDAIEEIVARACEDRLGSSETLRDFLIDLYAHDKDAANGFVKAVKEFLARLKEFFEKIAKIKSTAPEAQKFAQMGGDIVSELQKLFDEGVLAMREGNMARNAADLQKNTKSADESHQMMLRERENDGTVVDLSDDTELAKMVDGLQGAARYKVISQYIMDIVGSETLVLSDGIKATVDKRDSLHLAKKAGPRKVAQIAQVKQLVKNARPEAEEYANDHPKYNYFRYYVATVRYNDATYPVVLNIGRTINDGTYHFYDITKKIRDTANRINGFERPKPNEGYALQIDISNNSIPQNQQKSSDFEKNQEMFQDRDTDYLDAVNRGDMETAQKMVDEAAREAGYTVKAYHGSKENFTIFDYGKIGSATGVSMLGEGFYFTDKKNVAKGYGNKLYTVHLKSQNPYLAVESDIYKINSFKLQNQGYDSIRFSTPKGMVYSIFENTQIKSADPITYDDNGNVIPLSERFNAEQEDIRYQDREDYSGLTKKDFYKDSNIYSYDFLVAQEEMRVSTIPEISDIVDGNGKIVRGDIVKKALDNAKKNGKEKDGVVYVTNNYTKRDYSVSVEAIRHSLGGDRNRLLTNARIASIIGEVVKNGIPINALKNKASGVEGTYAIATLTKDSKNNLYVSIATIEQRTRKVVGIEDFDVVHAVSARQKNSGDNRSDQRSQGINPPTNISTDISIAQFLEIVNTTYQSILSSDVLQHLGYKRNPNGYYSNQVLYQDRVNLPDPSEILADVFKSGKAYEKYAEHSQALKKYKDIQVRLKNSEKRISKIDAEIKKLRSQRAQSGKGTRMDELYRMRKTAENKVESFRKQMFAMEAGDLYNVVISESRRLVEKQRKEDAEKYREKSKERTQNISKRGYIEMIEKRVKLLSKAITENSKDKHVPEIFKKTVGDFISAIDFSSKRALGGGAPTGKELSIAASMNAMSDTLANSSQNSDLSTYLEACDLKGDVAEAFAEIAKKINDIALANGNNNALTLQQMTVEELKALSDSVRTITHLVSAANKLIGDNRYARVEDLFVQTIEDLKNFKEYSRDPKKVGYKLAKMFEWDNALPYYAFKRMGKAAFSLFEEFQDGFDDFAFKARDIVEYTEKLYNSKESRTWTDEIHEIKLDNDRTVYMTTADIMSLYCLSKRTQARNHIFQGGIRLNQTRTGHLVGEEKAKKKTYANNQQNVVIDEPTLLKILAKLTDRQREVADGLQKFMVDECAKWGNEISMKRFGVPQFLDPTYFPITSSSLSLEKSENSTQEKTIYALLNASFTQKLNPHANNTVEVSDIFDVFATHAIEMAKYHAFAIPLIDMRKWENFRIKTGTNLGAQATGFETKGVREMLKNAFGDEAERYITTFLKDINSLQDRERGADLLQSLASKYKVQAVAANINVALIQPISYIRVSAVMNPKYMLEEVKDTFKIREAIKKAEKHSGMMVWKSLGYRDVNIAASLADKIKHTESMVEKLTENVTLKGAELADKLTWGAIWIACENEISDTHKGLAKGSAEYDKAVSRRFREVIYATQVVDSPLTKTQFMRGKTFWNSLTGSFMSEPSLSYNLFLDVATDIMDDKRKGKKLTSKHIKRLARAEGVLLISAFAEALIRSFLDALHDYDEEDEEYLDLYFSNFLETFLSSAFAPKTPILNAIYKAFAGAIKGTFTSSSGMDVVAFQKLGRLGRNIVRLFQGKDVSWTTFVKSVFDAFSSFSGIPISNVWREAKSIWNGIVGSQNPSALIK